MSNKGCVMSMKKTVLNSRWFVRSAFLIVWWCVYFFKVFSHKENDLYVYILGTVIVFSFFCLSPISYTFNEQFLSINYMFGFKRKLEWYNITKIARGDTRYDYTSYWVTVNKLNKGIDEYNVTIPANDTTRYYIKNFWHGDFN